MEIKITVERRRSSVTQGMVDVLVNGEKIMDFGDKIEIIPPGGKYYGELIGNWASVEPDTSFIIGALYHPHDECYNLSDLVKKALAKAELQERQNAPTAPTELQRAAEKYGWPLKIKARGEIARLVSMQPLNDGTVEPIYRFPGGDSLVDKREMIPVEEGDE